MGSHQIQPVSGEVERVPFVTRRYLLPDRWSGTIEVAWTIDPSQPLVLGAGWLVLEKPLVPPRRVVRGGKKKIQARIQQQARQQPSPKVVAEIARRGRIAVIPGSSLKGAIRQVYELLTASCRRTKFDKYDRPPNRYSIPTDSICQVDKNETGPEVCPACSFFGTGGLGSRLAFGEAVPISSDIPQQRKVPFAWPPRKRYRGTIKAYDSKEAVDRHNQPVEEKQLTYRVQGTFRSEIHVLNADEDELGLLFAALGLGAEHPMLRLGGKKFHGFGACDVEVRKLTRDPAREVPDEDQTAHDWASHQARAALDRDKARRIACESWHKALRRT